MKPLECNGCIQCCTGPNRFVRLYDWEHTKLEVETTDNGIRYLPMKKNGDCVYLGKRGCKVYEDRPIGCRDFDCRHFMNRDWFRKLYPHVVMAAGMHL